MSTLFQNKWIEVYEADGWYTCVRGSDTVCILAYRKNSDILMRWEHTPCHKDGTLATGANGKHLNLTSITGMIDDDETPEQAAIRELREETGYVVEAVTPQGWVYPTKHSPDKVYLFSVELEGEPTEDISGDGTQGEEGASTVWVSEIDFLTDCVSAPLLACYARLSQPQKNLPSVG